LVARRGLLPELLGEDGEPCALQSLSAEAGETIPPSWYERHAFGLVRRGVLIRQRIDEDGRRTAVDAATPGCLIPLRMAHGACTSTGYAATRVVLCVYPKRELDPHHAPQTTLDRLALIQEELDRLERIASARGRPSAHEQVWALLDALADSRPTERPRKPLRLRQKDIALLLNVRPETVCRALRRLASAGMIRQTSDGILPLASTAALRFIEDGAERRAHRRGQ
jgi:CRP-like cAMP-binding protein